MWKSCGFDANLFVLLNKIWCITIENEKMVCVLAALTYCRTDAHRSHSQPCILHIQHVFNGTNRAHAERARERETHTHQRCMCMKCYVIMSVHFNTMYWKEKKLPVLLERLISRKFRLHFVQRWSIFYFPLRHAKQIKHWEMHQAKAK